MHVLLIGTEYSTPAILSITAGINGYSSNFMNADWLIAKILQSTGVQGVRQYLLTSR